MVINSSIKTEYINTLPATLTYKSRSDTNVGCNLASVCYVPYVPDGYTTAKVTFEYVDCSSVLNAQVAINGQLKCQGTDYSTKVYSVSAGDFIDCYTLAQVGISGQESVTVVLSK